MVLLESGVLLRRLPVVMGVWAGNAGWRNAELDASGGRSQSPVIRGRGLIRELVAEGSPSEGFFSQAPSVAEPFFLAAISRHR